MIGPQRNWAVIQWRKTTQCHGVGINVCTVKVAESCLTPCDPRGLYSPWNSLGQNTGIGSLSLLQGIFPTQGSNPGLQLQADLLPAEPPGKPKNTGVGKPIPSPADPPNPGIKLGSPALQADSFPTDLSGKPQTDQTSC